MRSIKSLRSSLLVFVLAATAACGGGGAPRRHHDMAEATPSAEDCQSRCVTKADACADSLEAVLGTAPDVTLVCGHFCDAEPSGATLDCLDATPCSQLVAALEEHACAAPSAACTEGDKRCATSGNVETCKSGAWVKTETCKSGCSDGGCATATTCTSGAKRCNSGGNVETCASGKWTQSQICSDGCTSGVCDSAVEPCPIPKSSVVVALPYSTILPATIIDTVGVCYHSLNGSVAEGWDSATILNIFESHQTSALSVKDGSGSGVLYTITIKLHQREPSASELASLAATTGIPADLIMLGSSSIIRTTFDDPVINGDPLPAGVSVQAFLPTSTSSDGYIQFQAAAADKSKLDEVLTRLASGISMDLVIGRFSGSAVSTYSLIIGNSSPYVAVIAIKP